jgi:hypothetical protein
MQNLLEDKNNLNHDTFIIPAQEGGSEDDRYLASIGDAVQQHVYSLDSSKRQLWDSLLHMDNTGAIFRIEDSPFHRDLDPFNLEKEEDLEKAFQLKIMTAFKGKDVDPEFVQVLKDEFEKEVERRQKSEDIADIGVPIPYHDWEKFPQMHKHWDIQPTPKPLFIYMGSSRPWFYDEMPEYHPDKSKIEKVLQVFNRDWDEITEEFVDWVNDNIINEMFFKDPMVPPHLYGMALALEKGHIPPEQAVSEALKAIDTSYQETYKTNSLKIRDEDPIHQILNMNTEVWREQAKQGLKPFNSVKKLGYTLYKDHLDKTSTSHWTRYKGLKKEFAPVISFKSIDLNRASVCELKQTLNVTDSEARNIWFARPFYNLGTLINKGYLSPSRVTKNPQTEKTLNLIENKLALAIQEEDGQILTKLGKVLRGIEVKGLTKISKDEWQTIWFYYRAAKGEIFNVLNEIERRKKNDAKKEESTS